MSDNQTSKLPKWAQDRMATLTRKAQRAEQTLRDYMEFTIPSKVELEDCAGSKHFVQTKRVTIKHADVNLIINLSEKDRIELNFYVPKGAPLGGEACFMPSDYQQVNLANSKNLNL
jgi:hypothetical protein